MNARDKACFDKKVYWDETSAMIVAQKREFSGSPRLRAYKCRYCFGWHLTKKNKNDRTKARNG